MCTITATEFKENLGKYLKLALEEEIEIKHKGQPSVFLCPKSNSLLLKTESFFGMLPNEVLEDEDIPRE